MAWRRPRSGRDGRDSLAKGGGLCQKTVPEGCADNGESTGLPLMQPTKWSLRLPPPRGAAAFFLDHWVARLRPAGR